MTHPHEPFVPEIIAGDLSQPLRCLDCGQELELRCAQGHRHTANVGEIRTRKPRADKGRPRTTPVAYKPKQCSCGATFTPAGPNTKRCDTCRNPSLRATPV